MAQSLIFRIWYYFRIGWANYFTFAFAAVNTLVVTYYLAIEQAPILKGIFPSFPIYVGILASIGIPTLIGIGYYHFKKSNAYKAERDISVESDPYVKRILQNTTIILPLYLQLSQTLLKISDQDKITKEEKDELHEIQSKLAKLIELNKTEKEVNSKMDEIK